MNILLVDLGSSREEYNEPIGIQCVASALQTEFDVRLRWFMADESIPRSGELEAIDVLGLSVQIGALGRLGDVMQQVRACRNPPCVVVGNLLATYAPEELVKRWPEVICVRSEGESAFRTICRICRDQRQPDPETLSRVPNLAFSTDSGVRLTAIEGVGLEDLQPPRRPFADFVSANGGIARVEGSRGCHWGLCEFCSVASRFGLGVWKPFPIAHIIASLGDLSDSGIRSPYFTDEDFFGRNYGRGTELADAILAAKDGGTISPDMTFFISMLASDFRSQECKEALARLRSAGLREVFVGVEAGSDEELRRFQKKARKGTNVLAIDEAQGLGLQLDIGFICFEPLMSFADLLANLEFLESLDLPECDSRVLKRLRIQPFTALEGHYRDAICGPLDLDSLTYPYVFQDERVGRAWEAVRTWNESVGPRMDRLLAGARGEVAREDDRIERKRAMALFRAIDIKALRSIVTQIGSAADGMAAAKRLGELEQQRDRMLNTAETTLLAS